MSDTKLAPSAPKTTFAHRLYTGDFQFDFMAHRRRWYTISAVLLLISVLAVSVRGLNLGIDFVILLVLTAILVAIAARVYPRITN